MALAALTVGALAGLGWRLAWLRSLAGLGSLARRGGLAGASLVLTFRLARRRHRHRGPSFTARTETVLLALIT